MKGTKLAAISPHEPIEKLWAQLGAEPFISMLVTPSRASKVKDAKLNGLAASGLDPHESIEKL